MELEDFDWNISTFAFVATMFITLIQAWGMLEQRKTIREQHSADSLSLPVLLVNVAYFWISFIYGVNTLRIANIFSGLLAGVLGLLIFHAISVCKNSWSVLETVSKLFAVVAAIVACVMETGEGQIFFAISVLAAMMAIHQPYTMWRSGKVGSVNIRFFATFLLGATFWTIYGYVTSDWVQKIICPIFMTSHFLTIALYYGYRKVQPVAV